ncbi:type I restriction endonuclease [Pseudomonas sp. GL-R-26]|uniref:type I restriction endonuclease n=1 Tax=Pseudomonas sp. GL-R-26 TaxID=2832392 RepID=UPI001CBD5E11|nr:type I restriction endonuclease [Pseudomonas sp. GL-R-26]
MAIKFELPAAGAIVTESDVEQKIIYPLLVASEDVGLQYQSAEIITKGDIRKLAIDKLTKKKIYYPDYMVVIGGFPLLVIEAKKPDDIDVEEAFREARLYANELNAYFPTGVNPVRKVIATNGLTLLAGSSDNIKPQLEMNVSELVASSQKYHDLFKDFSRKSLDILVEKFNQDLYPGYLSKPRRLVGGRAVQDEEIGHNSFGANIASDLGHIFNPATIEDRIFIAKNGYIPSKRRERFIEPIDRLIRAAKPPSEINATTIEDTSAPRELVAVLAKQSKLLERKVILLVGSVGSGKTTFIDYLKEVALPADVIDRTAWVRINMNESPVSPDEIYGWLRHEIIEGCKSNTPQYDFDTLEGIKKVYSVELNRFEKIYKPLYDGTPEYNIKLGEKIEDLESDLHLSALAYTRFCTNERGKLLIIVLDNCDKRTLDEQLLMFQAAQWLQKEFRSLVILPLREETYDNHRDQPPLDTALKDLVFRIEPPLFQSVLAKRVQLALRALDGNGGQNMLTYELPNGYTVEYSKNDTSFYLTCILKSIFENDKYVRRIIVGLSARNIRRALEIFLEFCTSGHIAEDEIFKIRQTQGMHTLPLHIVSRVLLRMNRRYYDGDHSHVKNLFTTLSFGKKGNYFSRLMILRWLKQKFHNIGPSGVQGYFPVIELKAELIPLGVESDVIIRDLEFLLAGHCVVSEDFTISEIADDNLIKLAPAGFVHLDLLTNVSYLAALAEDTLYTEEKTAREITERIKSLDVQYNQRTAYQNATDFYNYIKKQYESLVASTSSYLESSNLASLASVSEMEPSLQMFKKNALPAIWQEAELHYIPGEQYTCEVVRYAKSGLIVKMHLGMTVFVHPNQLPKNYIERGYKRGDKIEFLVNSIDVFSQKIRLDSVTTSPVEEHD